MDIGTGSILKFGWVRFHLDKMNPIEKIYFRMGAGETQQVMDKGFKKSFTTPVLHRYNVRAAPVAVMIWLRFQCKLAI